MKLEIGQTVFVKPKEGLVVIDHLTMKPLPRSGKSIRVDSYWIRRFEDGDLVLENSPPVNATARAKKTERSEQ